MGRQHEEHAVPSRHRTIFRRRQEPRGLGRRLTHRSALEHLECRYVLTPLPPTGLTAEGVSASSIALSWNASSDPAVTSYDVYEKVWIPGVHSPRGSGGTPGHYAYDLRASNLTVPADTLAGLATGSTHSYVVTALSPAGQSIYSQVATAETWIAPSLPYGPNTFLLTSGALYSSPVNVTSGLTTQLSLLASGNPLNYAVASGPSNASIDAHSGVVTFTPDASQAGQTISVKFEISNTLGAVDQTIQFNVSAPSNSLPAPTLKLAATTSTYTGKTQYVAPEAVGSDGTTPVAGSFAVAYNGHNVAPVNVGSYQTLLTFTSADPNYGNATQLTTFTITKATPAFSNLIAPTIAAGTATTAISGSISAGTAVPAGDYVIVTFNGVSQVATVGANGIFSSYFATGSLAAGNYAISYSYAGDANLTAAADGASTLSVIPIAPPQVTLNPVNVTVALGDPASFTVAGTGVPTPAIQWQVSADGGATYTNISSNASAKTTNLVFVTYSGQTGYLYRAVFTNSVGTATSSAATLTLESDTGGGGVDAVETPQGAAIDATEGADVNGAVAAFNGSKVGSAADFTAQIDWGDGSSRTAGTVSGSAAAGYVVNGSHVYAQGGQTLPVSVVVSDSSGAATTIASTVNIVDAALTGGAAPVAATDGNTFSGALATFADANPSAQASDFAAAVDWGDGSAVEAATISGSPAAGFTVSGSHVYAEGGQTLPVTVVVSDAAGAAATIVGTDTVADAPLTGKAVTIAATEGSTFSGAVASFADANPSAQASNFTAAIDWGDGQTSAGTLVASAGAFSVVGSHVYQHSGQFTVKTAVNDEGGSTVCTSSAAAAISLDFQHAQFVTAVYHDVLGRAPDADGLAHWVQMLGKGAAASSVADAIGHSDEYYANFVIKPDYLKLLNRAADAAGVKYWTAKLQAGATDQELEAELAASTEFYQNAGGTDAAWIDAVYRLLLGRPADTTGKSYWNVRMSAGQSLLETAQRIAGGQENNSQLINDDYFHYLGRAADSAGLKFWLDQFAAGKTNEDVVSGITGAGEYYKEHSS